MAILSKRTVFFVDDVVGSSVEVKRSGRVKREVGVLKLEVALVKSFASRTKTKKV